MTETLTADEVREFRAMKDAWPAVQDALKMGTSDSPTRDGHAHRDNVIREQGSGAPTHVAKQGTLYWDKTGKIQYVNSSGSTVWAEQSSGGAAGIHAMQSTTHSDVINSPGANIGEVMRFISGFWIPFPPNSHGVHFTNALATAAVPFRLVIPLGSDRQGQVHFA